MKGGQAAPFSVVSNVMSYEGIALDDLAGFIAFPCIYPGDDEATTFRTTAVVVRSTPPAEKKYRTAYSKAWDYLPVMYSHPSDWLKMSERGSLVVVEGVADKLALQQVTELPVLARLSTGVSRALIRLIKRHAYEVFQVMDNDGPGRRAAENSTSILRQNGIKVHDVVLPRKDPAQMLQENGLDKLAAAFKSKLRMAF